MKWHVVVTGLVLAAGLLAGTARAQQQEEAAAPPPDTAAVDTTVDTTAAPARQQVYRYDGGAPASVMSVRRRIARIRGGGVERRIIYPLVIVQPPPPVYIQGGGQAFPPPGQAAQGYPPAPQYPYYAQPDEPPYYYRDEQGRIRILTGAEDSARVAILPGDSTVVDTVQVRIAQEPLPEEGAPPAEGPTVRRVARAILETGLFRAVGINFEFDESTLLPESERTLDAVGEVLVKYPELRVEVAGHTDAVGPESYNQQLSEARARAVKQYLVEAFALDPDRLTTRGYGESRPIATNENVTGRTLNRRVEFELLNPEAAEQYVVPGAAPSGLEESLRRLIREEIRRAQQEQD